MEGKGTGSPHPEPIAPLWRQERDIIERAIDLCGGNIKEAAARLEISDSTIYRKRARWQACPPG